MRSVEPWTDGPGIVEVGVPTHSPNGHVLIVGVIRVGWLPCSCVAGESGQPDVPMETCRAITYHPPHDAASNRPPDAGTPDANVGCRAATQDFWGIRGRARQHPRR